MNKITNAPKTTNIKKGVIHPIKPKKSTKIKNNKTNHAKNGNNKQIKFLSWNKANSKMIYRMDTIRHITEKFTPDIFSLQETNISTADDLKDYQMENYDLLIDKMHKKHGLARTSIYISQKIKYLRRDDLESDSEPMIAITVYPIRAQPFNFINFYRQWQIVGLNGSIPKTKNEKAQFLRFSTVIEKWKTTINERETISVSDTNINLDKNFNDIESLDLNEKKRKNNKNVQITFK